LVIGGERADDEELDFEFDENGINDEVVEAGEEVPNDDANEGWEARFARFKKEQKVAEQARSDIDESSDGGDTVGTLPQFSVIGGKKRRKGSSEASGYSMSSSSMFRNAGLTTLDERFDQVHTTFVFCA
jgi:protein LTV1